MKSAIAVGGAGIDSVEIKEVDVPKAGPGQALVKLTAATLNFRDLIMLKGLLPGLTKEPDYVPLSCAAGEVIEVGDGVSRVSVGDRVSPLFAQGWFDGPPDPNGMLGGLSDGVAREYGVFDAESLCLIPDELGDMEAATLPCAGLTAWSALFGQRPLQAGEWVICQGTGGVSIAALQWAKAAGANVLITSSSDRKLARAKALGADLVVNYRHHADWAKEASRLLDGQRASVFVDVVGQKDVAAGASLLATDGIISSVGMLESEFSWTRQEVNGHPVVPVTVGTRSAHEAMLAFAAEHGIRPVVDWVYDLSRLPDALRHLERGDFVGKVGINLL